MRHRGQLLPYPSGRSDLPDGTWVAARFNEEGYPDTYLGSLLDFSKLLPLPLLLPHATVVGDKQKVVVGKYHTGVAGTPTAGQ